MNNFKKIFAAAAAASIAVCGINAAAENTVRYGGGSVGYGSTSTTIGKAPAQSKPVGGNVVVSVNNGVPDITVNGAKLKFPDAQPFIDNENRTQTPVRVLAEALGCTVNWNSKLETVTFTHSNGMSVYLTIGDNCLYTDSGVVKMDTAAMLIDDRTYVPLWFIADALGFNVTWNWDN